MRPNWLVLYKMKEIGIGLIGFGMMGKIHTYAYRNLPLYYRDLPFRVKLVGVCSGHLANACLARDELGYEFATDNYQEILDRSDIDVVNICTPNNLHHEMILAAIAAGKNIYCDKPLTVNSSQAAEIIDALEGRSLIHQVALQNRFFPATMRARQLVEEGRIGKVMSFRAVYLHAGSVNPGLPTGWKLDARTSGGGVLLDLGSHVLDLIYFLLGEFSQVIARSRVIYPQRPDQSGKLQDIQAEDSILVLAEMKDGSQGSIEASKVATGINDELRFEIHGDRGAIRFNLMEPGWLDYYDNTQPERSLGGNRGFTRIECIGRYDPPGGSFPSGKASVGWLRGHVHCLYRFLDCVSAQKQASPSFHEGAYIQNVMAKIYESDRTGQWQHC